MMPIRDPRDRFFYPILTLIMDSYNLHWQIFVQYTVLYFLPVLPPRTLDDITKEEFSHVLDVNILGAFLVSKVIKISVLYYTQGFV